MFLESCRNKRKLSWTRMWSHWECDWDSTELAWESSRYFATSPLVSREMTSERRLQKFHTDVHNTDLGSASDWLKQISLATRPIRSNAQIRVMTSHWYGISYFQVPSSLHFKARLSAKPLIRKWFLIMMQIKLIFSTKVSHLASFWKRDFWNTEMAYFCSRCSDVISQEDQ